MGPVINERDVVHEKRSPADVLTSQKWPAGRPVDSSPAGWRDSASDLYRLVAELRMVPVLRNHPHLGLLVAGLQFHTAPIFLRCSSTRAARVFTPSVS